MEGGRGVVVPSWGSGAVFIFFLALLSEERIEKKGEGRKAQEREGRARERRKMTTLMVVGEGCSSRKGTRRELAAEVRRK